MTAPDSRHMTGERERDQRIATLERKIELLRSPVLVGRDPEEPVGYVSDFQQEDWPAAYRNAANRDHLPIPAPADREGYQAGDHGVYWRMGYEEYEKVRDAAQQFVPEASRIYDFGGSTGRVFRHFHCQGDWEVWSSDFKLTTFLWNQRHMPQTVRCFLNGFVPALPIPDAYFPVITAFSVFTHIDELEIPWLLELRRILKPGGLLYLTVHEEHQWANMPPQLLSVLQKSDPNVTAESPFPGPRRAYAWTQESYYNCNVFHSQAYVEREWGRFFDVIEMRPLESAAQCVVLMTH
jgi:ubiquinone/menaquinone biosynthesis C-methylase UbiE